MKNKTIYLIRHGETDYNRQGIVQGSGINADLNEFGKAQAAAFYDAYGHVPFDKIYTSELIRTQQSVQNFIDNGIPTEALSGLNEISWGIYEGKAHTSMQDGDYQTVVKNWSEGHFDIRLEGGESPLDVQARQLPVLKKILDNTHERNIIIAMHGRAMRIFLSTMFGNSLAKMDQYQHNNLCLYKISYDDTTGEFTLISANDIVHLLSLQVPL